jgi:hypothetical protein
MAQRVIITDDLYVNEILDYCRVNRIAVLQGRSYTDGCQVLCWQIYCEDTARLDFLLLKFGSSLTLI